MIVLPKENYIKDLFEGQKLIDYFYVEQKESKTTRSGKPFLDVKLRDKTGSINAKVWDHAQKYSAAFSKEDFVKIQAVVETYQGAFQVKIEKVRKAKDEEISIADFLPVSKNDVDAMFSELLEYVDSVENIHIGLLLESFFRDEEFAKKYKGTPAAKSVHHTYLGGLMEHSLSVTKTCEFLAGHYENLNRDLLICGALLHDVGKTRELEVKGGFSYSMEGELVGHTIIGIMMIREKIVDIPDFPERLAQLIEHMLLSHHGVPEWGAVKRPLFKEAVILNYADEIDARMNLIESITCDDAINDADGLWSDKCWYLDGRRFLKVDKFI